MVQWHLLMTVNRC